MAAMADARNRASSVYKSIKKSFHSFKCYKVQLSSVQLSSFSPLSAPHNKIRLWQTQFILVLQWKQPFRATDLLLLLSLFESPPLPLPLAIIAIVTHRFIGDFHFQYLCVNALHFAQWPSNLHNPSIARLHCTATTNSFFPSIESLCLHRELVGMFERKTMPKQKDTHQTIYDYLKIMSTR